MTITGPDISSFEHGVNVRALTDRFVLMKCTEGLGYVDADYPTWLAQAKATRKIAIAYHFIGPQDPAAQAAHLAAHIIDRSIPVMVDFEDEGPFHPTLAQLLALNDAITAAGLRVRLNYLPRWKWQEMGSPSLAGIATRGIGLVSSAYPGGQAYPGDNAPGWQAYGGMVPLIYQFTDVAVEGGQRVGDVNAYKGTIEQLAGFLGVNSPTPTPTSSGSDVNLDDKLGPISTGLAALTPDAASEGLGAGAEFTVGAALAGMAVRQAETLILLKRLAAAAPQPPAVDINALAAALSGHITVTTDVDALAAALVPHLPGVPDAVAFATALAAHIKVV